MLNFCLQQLEDGSTTVRLQTHDRYYVFDLAPGVFTFSGIVGREYWFGGDNGSRLITGRASVEDLCRGTDSDNLPRR